MSSARSWLSGASQAIRKLTKESLRDVGSPSLTMRTSSGSAVPQAKKGRGDAVRLRLTRASGLIVTSFGAAVMAKHFFFSSD